MAIDPELFIHDSDRSALSALQAIPGFTQVLKAFMKIWNEKQYKILNMSTFVRVSDKQMAKYREMLIPICSKLGIAVPELYVALSPVANAYTSGDTEPFIVMTSGLINTVPEELIPTVLAHECGHIACHHVLYTTMGKMILNGATDLLGLSSLITTPLQMAFYYWMRCSEYSADRAAAVCDGGAGNTVDVCMRLAGFDKNIPVEPNKKAFMAQALSYRKMMESSKFNKTMEFLMFNRMNHPLNAVRALECYEWAKTDDFKHLAEFAKENSVGMENHRYIPVQASSHYVDRDLNAVVNEFIANGFTNIRSERVTERAGLTKENSVVMVSVDGKTDFPFGTWVFFEAPIVITYFMPLSYEEESAIHPGEVKVPNSSSSYLGKPYQDVIAELKAAGFENFTLSEQADLRMGLLIKEGGIARIAIDHNDRFDKGTWFRKESVVDIRYHIMADKAGSGFLRF